MALSTDDHFAIQQLNVRYAHSIDAGDSLGWAACFAPDGVFVLPSGVEVAGHPDLAELARDTAAAPDAPLRRHWVGAIHAEETDGGASARCYGLVVRGGEEPGILATVMYEDDLERVEGRWLFRRRAVHVVH